MDTYGRFLKESIGCKILLYNVRACLVPWPRYYARGAMGKKSNKCFVLGPVFDC